MRFGAKAIIWAACAGPAVAAMVVTAAGTANAAPVSPHDNGFGLCSSIKLEQWNLNGSNTVDLKWNGGSYTYNVKFAQNGSCLTGFLTDTGLPSGEQKLQVYGSVNGSDVTFTVAYPTNVQGFRTFDGTIGNSGAVSGSWHQSGTQTPNNGSWKLAGKAKPACPPLGILFLPGCSVAS
jgi:hypothetical protein